MVMNLKKLMAFSLLFIILISGVYYLFFYQEDVSRKELKEQVIDMVANYVHDCLKGDIVNREITLTDHRLANGLVLEKGTLFFNEECQVRLAVFDGDYCVMKDYEKDYFVFESDGEDCWASKPLRCLDSDDVVFANGKIKEYLAVDEKEICIPAQINGSEVRVIGANAFADVGLKKITLPNTVTRIEEYAFFNNQLETLSLPTNLLYLGSYAFFGNEIDEVVIPSSVVDVGNNVFSIAFQNLSWVNRISDDFWLSDNDTLTGIITFDSVLEIPDTFSVIAAEAFVNLEIEKLYIPDSVIIIKDNAFLGSGVKEVIMASDDVIIGSNNFEEVFLNLYEENGAGNYLLTAEGIWEYLAE